MNLIVYPLFRVEGSEEFEHYAKMAPLMRESARKNVRGMHGFLEITGEFASMDEAFRHCFNVMRVVNMDCSLVLVGVDTLFVTEINPWSHLHMVLWRPAEAGYMDIEKGAYRLNSTAFFPRGLSNRLWALGDSLWEGYPRLPDRHDFEQYVMNRMYYDQGYDEPEPDFGADVNDRMIAYPNTDDDISWKPGESCFPETPDPLVISYHAQRGPKQSLKMMERDCKRYGVE